MAPKGAAFFVRLKDRSIQTESVSRRHLLISHKSRMILYSRLHFMRRTLPTAVLFACLSAASWTQPRPATTLVAPSPLSKELIQQLESVREAALNSDYAWRQLAHLTENIGPRPAGSLQAQAASEYVAAEMRKLGLDVHLEEARVSHFVRGDEKAELVEFPGQPAQVNQKIVLTALSGGTATPPEGITADVVVVRSFDELTALGRDKVAGKIVLFSVHYDVRKAQAGSAFDAYGEAVVYRGNGGKAVAALGGAASLVRSIGAAEYRLPHTGFSYPAPIPAAALAAEDADLIERLAAQGRVRMHLTLTPQHLPDTTGYNVVADIKGSEHPEQIVVVSGHLDSWDLGRGAIDDGAGVVISMATAEILQRLHLRPRRTLRVIAWMDEENGGGGHDAYGKSHASEMPNHVAAIESDAGAGHPLGFSAKMSPAAAATLRPILEVLRPVGSTVMRPTNVSPGSDIEPLVDAGVPGLGIIQDGRRYFDYHHTAADTLDKVDPQELRENAAAMAVMGYALAAMPDPLPR